MPSRWNGRLRNPRKFSMSPIQTPIAVGSAKFPLTGIGFLQKQQEIQKDTRSFVITTASLWDSVWKAFSPLSLSLALGDNRMQVRSEFGAACELWTNLHPDVTDIERRGSFFELQKWHPIAEVSFFRKTM